MKNTEFNPLFLTFLDYGIKMGNMWFNIYTDWFDTFLNKDNGGK